MMLDSTELNCLASSLLGNRWSGWGWFKTQRSDSQRFLCSTGLKYQDALFLTEAAQSRTRQDIRNRKIIEQKVKFKNKTPCKGSYIKYIKTTSNSVSRDSYHHNQSQSTECDKQNKTLLPTNRPQVCFLRCIVTSGVLYWDLRYVVTSGVAFH